MTEQEDSARKKRNLVIAWGLVAFMLLVFAVTIIKMKLGVGV